MALINHKTPRLVGQGQRPAADYIYCREILLFKIECQRAAKQAQAAATGNLDLRIESGFKQDTPVGAC